MPTHLPLLLTMVFSLLQAYSNVTRKQNGVLHFHWTGTGLGPLFAGLFLLLVFQMIPIPNPVLLLFSPEGKVAGDMSLYPPGLKGSWHALAPYIYPVRMSLVRWVAYGLIFFGFVQLLDSRKRIELAVILIVLLCCFEALYGILQTYSHHEHIWWLKKTVHVGDVTGTYINRNHFAGLMEMGIVLAIAYAGSLARKGAAFHRTGFRERFLYLASEKNLMKRLLVVFAGVVMALGLFLSASRGGIIAITGATLVMGFLLFFRKEHRRMGSVILVLFILATVYALVAGMDYTVGRFLNMGEEYGSRLRYMQNTINLFSDYPAVGVGIGNYAQAFSKWQSPDDKHFLMDYAHNDWVQFAAEAGITGLLILAGLAYYVYAVLKKWRSRQDPLAVSLGIAPLGAMTAIGIHSYSDFNLHIPANFMMLAAVAAIGWSALHLETRHRREEMKQPFHCWPLRKGGGAVLAILLISILWSGVWTVRHLVAEAYCGTVPNSSMRLEENPKAERIRQAIAWDPGNAEYRYKLARELMRTRDTEVRESGTDMTRWHEWTSPIVSALEKAAQLNPLRAEYHMHLGWQYSYLSNRPDYTAKWLPAADECMDRAAYYAGYGAENPHLLVDLGNYWTMRSKTIDPTDPKQDVAWTKAVWHYQKALEMEKSKDLAEAVVRYVKGFYPDEYHWKQVIP